MSESEKYTPLSERLQQDVWHDNFVPKYSALASAKPSKLVLIGVWLIFAPMALGAIVAGLSALSGSPDLATAVLTIGSILFFILTAAILYTQTRRYRLAKLQPDDNDDEDDDAIHAPGEGVTKS